MDNFKDFIKTNKNFLIITVSVVVAIIFGTVGFNIFVSMQNQSEDPTPEKFLVNDFDIPNIEDVKVEETPTLYDFIYGTIGYHSDLGSMVGTTPQLILMTKEGSSKVYASYMPSNEGPLDIALLLPNFNTAPKAIYMESESDLNTLNDLEKQGVDKGEIKTLKEGDYIFYNVPMSSIDASTSKFGSIDVQWLINNSDSSIQYKNTHDGGQGYPTDIIRKFCDVETINKVSNIDFNDEFWDDVNYKSNIKCYSTEDPSKFCILTPTKVSIVSDLPPVYTYLVNGMVMGMEEEELDKFLVSSKYEPISTALQNKKYATEIEYNDMFAKKL